jgi:hypothetical protein
MSEGYEMEIYEGHLIVTIDKFKALIDTGAPNSIGEEKQISIQNKIFPLEKLYCGVNVKQLNQYVGLTFDMLIGMDILSEFDIFITKNKFHFKEQNSIQFNHPITMKNVGGVPIVNILVNNNKTKVFFDTGAKITYTKMKFLSKEQIGVKNDFHPFSGKFTTKTFEGDFSVGKERISIESGVCEDLPKNVQQMIGNCDGILGTELLEKYTIQLSISQELFELTLN